jgi:hypothetical protein
MFGVNRVILAVGHPLPVFPAKQTCQAATAKSQRCQDRTSTAKQQFYALCIYSITSSARSSRGAVG